MRPSGIASFLLLFSAFALSACEADEHAILILVQSEQDVGSIRTRVIQLDGRHLVTPGSVQVVNRSAADTRSDPIRVVIQLPEPETIMVRIEADEPGNPGIFNLVASRCYAGGGVVNDSVLLARLDSLSDPDGDGFPADPAVTCLEPNGGPCLEFACAAGPGDCAPEDGSIFPGAAEICEDGLDQDCFPGNEACGDADGDMWRACPCSLATDPTCDVTSCDCNDTNPEINPGVEEDFTTRCGDGIDDNCDGIQPNCDTDGDGFPADRPTGGMPDCDDTNPAINPNATEVCTDPADLAAGIAPVDENCNGLFDELESCIGEDLDGDGVPFCDRGQTPEADQCDCNDCDPGVFPARGGQPAAVDRCGNGIDEDCIGGDEVCPPSDMDGDASSAPLDCDDDDIMTSGCPRRFGPAGACAPVDNCATTGAGEDESCGGNLCDGSNDPDGDGWSEPDDCENSPMNTPFADEICNADIADNDCDGIIDEMVGYNRVRPERGCVLPQAGEVRDNLCIAGERCFINHRNSIYHCGGCRVACSDNANECRDGGCICNEAGGTAACEVGSRCCGDGVGCRAIQVDTNNCGSCGNVCNPKLSDSCVDGSCSCGAGAACAENQRCCGGTCVSDLDNNHCGGCNDPCGPSSSCTPAGASFRCMCGGTSLDCNGDVMAPGGNGCEVTNPAADVNNCGGCGVLCPRGNASPSCAANTCSFTCNGGFDDCNLSPGDACETRLGTIVNCTACRDRCATPAQATPTCGPGGCGFDCNPTHGDCNGGAANGCETDLRTNRANCGGCGNNCPDEPQATGICAARMCGIRCDANFADCDGVSTTGCEVDTRTDVNNCNGCTNVCPNRPGSTPTCVASACGFTCNGLRNDCNGMPGDGCESNPRTDPNNCNMCGNSCPSGLRSTATCTAGTCGLTCDDGWGDCNGNPADGCEVDLNTSEMYCGSCTASPCTAAAGETAMCMAGTCNISCMPGFMDCDSSAPGCECAPPPVGAVLTCSASMCDYECAPNRCGDADAGGCPGMVGDDDNCAFCEDNCPGPMMCTAGVCG